MIPLIASRSVFLRPGELAIVQEPAVISTVLGSCVAFSLYHRRRQLAGMNHALLPTGDGGNRFVDSSARNLLEEFLRRGVRRSEIEVKLFGGADLFVQGEKEKKPGVGAQNVAAAFAFIEREQLRLAASDVGGGRGRKIAFDTLTGEVILHRLPRQIPSARR